MREHEFRSNRLSKNRENVPQLWKEYEKLDSAVSHRQKLWDKFITVNLRLIKLSGELKFVPEVEQYYKMKKEKEIGNYLDHYHIRDLRKIEVNIKKESKIKKKERKINKKENSPGITSVEKLIPSTDPIEIKKGGSKKTKKVRKHRGIVQTGGSAGRLRKGYKYTGRRLKNGQAEIKKVKSKK
jgi:hypothetical protein